MNTTIDQWEVLEAVVQLGSFASAAAKMNRSQSTTSYAVSRLQEQFKIPLLKMKGRKVVLTAAGKALLAEAEPLLAGFRALEQRATSPAAGGERLLGLSVDCIYPDNRLFAALSELARSFPHIHPRLHKTPFISSVYEFAALGVDLCVTALPADEPFIKPILDVRMQAVAKADHPLHAETGRLTRLDLIRHLLVIIQGTTGSEIKQQPHIKSQPVLPVDTIESAIEAVRSGMCFGWLPAYRIAPYLHSGELVRLRLPMGGERTVRLFLVMKDVEADRPENDFLADLLGVNRALEVL